METNNKQKSVAEVISLRGTGKIYLPDNAFEFVPQKKGEPMQKDVKNQLKIVMKSEYQNALPEQILPKGVILANSERIQ